MNSSLFPGNMKADEVLIGTAKRPIPSALKIAHQDHPNYREVRFGTEVRGTDGKTKFPIFGKDK